MEELTDPQSRIERIYEIFDSGGLLSRKLEHFEYREDQLSMALDIERCYTENLVGAIEAGTGTGKSFAYLVPALLRAFEDPEDRTVIATSTINLQKQLLEKDLPALFRILGKECSTGFAVGRGNYICLRRLAGELSRVPLMVQAGVSELSDLNRFANETETGLITDYPGRIDPETWARVCSDADLCTGGRCPFFSRCFYFAAKKKLESSSIIICNHHLLFVDSSSRLENDLEYTEDAVLPPFGRLVVDEAHNMERHATDLFTVQFSSRILHRRLDSIYASGPKSAGTRLLDTLAPACRDSSLYGEIVKDMALVNSGADTLNMVLLGILDANGLAHLLLTRENADSLISQIEDTARMLCSGMEKLTEHLVRFNAGLRGEEAVQRGAELSVHITRIKAAADLLKAFISWKQWNEDIHYIETEKHGSSRYAVMKTAPIEVSGVLGKALFEKLGSVICTSATLDLKDGFRYWSASVGLPAAGKGFFSKVYSSPFDYRHNLMLLTPYDAPDYKNDGQEVYTQFLCSAIYSAVSSSGGGALVLFTNRVLMDYIYKSLYPRLEALGINVMKQGDLDRYALLEKFRKDTDSVLFAMNSFWEGVDAPGNTLRLLIITKLPFRMPEEPVYKARYTRLEKEGRSGFFCLSLPDAVMKLKQGFGRLMRHTEDKGIVLILDSRILSRSYGALMLGSLPESYHPETSYASVSEKIESFLY